MGIETALIGSALIGGASSLFGASKSSDAAEKAAEMQLQASRESIAAQKEMYAKNTDVMKEQQAQNTGLYNNIAGNNTPFIQNGQNANKVYADLSGANGADAQAAAMKAYQSSPYLQDMIKNANAATMTSAGASGAGMSGNVLNALYRQNADLYNQDYANYLGNLGNVANQGLSANQTLAGETGQLMGSNTGLASALMGVGTNTANGVSNALQTGAQGYGTAIQNAGNTQAAGIMGAGNALTGAANNYMNYSMLSNLLKNGGGVNALAGA
jgi:hypothetical protein